MSHLSTQNPIDTIRTWCNTDALIQLCLKFISVVTLMLPAMVFAQTTLNSGATINITMNQGQPFSQSFVGTGTLDNSYTLNGTAPPGINVTTISAPPPATFGHNMVLSGTPTSSGVYSFNIDVIASQFSTTTNYSTTLVVTVIPPAPTANNSNQTVLSNSTGNVLTPSTSGAVTSIGILAAPSHGNAVVSGTTIIYTPVASYVGTDSISFQATGPGGSSGIATISITVAPPAPSVSTTNATVATNSTNNVISPTITGSATSISVISTPAHGSAIPSGLNVLYTPSAGYSGNDSFLVTATGPGGTSASATVNITVTPPAPSIAAISSTVAANSSNNTITPVITGSVTSITVSTAPAHGSATVSGLTVLYTPSAGYSGNDSFSLTATGPGGTSAAANVSITVTPPAPSVAASSSTVAANSSNNSITPVVTGTASSIAVVSTPAHGTATVSGMAVQYTPSAGYSGNDSFSVTATGPGGTSAPATISVTVTPPAPSISASSATVPANSSNNTITPTITGSVTSISLVTSPAHGSAIVSGLTVRYTPSAGYSGNDSFSVSATGPGGTSSAANISITVTPPAPTVTPSNITVSSNSSANSISPIITGTATSISIASAPAHGSATVSGLTVLYTPAAGYSGSDSISVTATGPGGTSAATSISINVVAAAVAPSVADSNVAIAANSTSNPLAPSITGNATSITIVSAPIHGSATVSGLNILYTPNAGYIGNDSLSLTANGPGGVSNLANINITVNPPAPTVSSSNVTIAANSSNNSIVPVVSGNATSIILNSPPAHGSASVNGLNVLYTPSNGYTGGDSFTFSASGPGGISSSANVSINVVASVPVLTVNDAIVAGNSNDNIISPTITGIANTLSVIGAPSHGIATISGLTIRYTPSQGYSGADALTIIATGPGGSSAPLTINITVQDLIPTTSNSSATVVGNSNGNTLTPNISGNVSSIIITSPASHGAASVNGTNLTYTPTPGYLGSDSISFVASGPGGSSNPATISINVVSPQPQANNSSVTVIANSSANVLRPQFSGNVSGVTIVSQASHGSVAVNGLNLTYTPTPGYIGPDAVSFAATGSSGNSATATISITVIPSAATAPSIKELDITVVANSASNAITPQITGTANSLAIVSAPQHGTTNGSGLLLSYTPAKDYVGSDSITITATGPGGTSAPANIRITVIPAPPNVAPSSVQVAINSVNNAITPAITGIATSLSLNSTPAHGKAIVSGLGISYTPNLDYVGDDSFSIIATGPGGNSAPATMSISVIAAPPTIAPSAVSVVANSVSNAITPKITGLANSISINKASAHGTVSINGLALTYTPNTGYVGPDSVTLIATGNGGNSAPAEITIDVKPLQPSALNVTVQTNSTSNLITVPTVAGAVGTALSGQPAHGTTVLDGLGVRYTPANNYVGSDNLKIQVNGSNGALTSVDVSINVVATAPILSRAKLSVESGRTASIDLASTISGPLYAGVTLAVSQAPAHGVFSLVGTKLSFTANADFAGSDSLSFTATTLGGTSKAAQLDITIIARPDPSVDRGVLTLHNATTAMVRHFEQVQIDQFNGRLLEIASKNKTSDNADAKPTNGGCGQIGMWVSGLNSYGSYLGRDGSKFTTMGYSTGADRCFGSSDTTVGIGLGYARDHIEMPLTGANLTASANTVASYLSTKLIPALRLSFVAGVNQIGSRYQRLETNANTQVLGEWHGNQLFSSSAISGDVDLALIKISPFVKMDISNLSLDPYTETGASPYLLHYHQQSMRSQRSTIGFNSEMTIETPWGELIPRFRMEVQRDAAKRNSLKINYVDFPDAIYLIPSNELDRRVALFAFGADMNWKNGIVTIINVTRTNANQNNQNNRINVRFSYKY